MNEDVLNYILAPLFSVILRKDAVGAVYIERFEVHKTFYGIPIREQRKIMEEVINEIEGKPASTGWRADKSYN